MAGGVTGPPPTNFMLLLLTKLYCIKNIFKFSKRSKHILKDNSIKIFPLQLLIMYEIHWNK